ncbi:MAG: hypothetical protein KAI86_11300, partial [Desulfobacterales bacterium]|nr:hypothetical protein [Desulfobacterales bacterium]
PDGVRILIDDRIKSCRLFLERKCPNQLLIEKAYLFPQILDPKHLQECQELAQSCEIEKMRNRDKLSKRGV